MKTKVVAVRHTGGAQLEAVSNDILKSKSCQLDKASLLCYARALLFEKTCDGYIYGSPPLEIEKYLEEFKDSTTTIVVDGPAILECPGINAEDSNSAHFFLPLSEPNSTCSSCKRVFCEYCMFSHSSSPAKCIICERANTDDSSLPSQKEMRQALIAAGNEAPADASYANVSLWFDLTVQPYVICIIRLSS